MARFFFLNLLQTLINTIFYLQRSFTFQNLMIACHGITPTQSELKEARQWPDICLPKAFSFTPLLPPLPRWKPPHLCVGSNGVTCLFLFRSKRNIICKSSALILAILLLFCLLASSEGSEEFALSEVVAKYRKAVDENPVSVEAYMNLGFVYLALDAMEQAVEAFQNVPACAASVAASRPHLDSKFAESYYWLGRIKYLQEKYDESISSFQTAVSLLSNWGEAYAELGLCYFRMHKYDEAESAFSKSLSLIKSSNSYRRRFVPPPIFDKDDQEWINKMSPLKEADIAYYLSVILFERGFFDKAAEYCHQAISIEPKFAEAYRQLGTIHVQKKEWAEAEKAFREAIRQRPEMAQAHYQLALLYFKMGKETEAAKEMEISQQLNKAAEPLQEQRDALIRNTDKAPALSNIGRIYLNEKKYEEAIREYKKALWHNPNLAEAHNGIGYAYAMQGRFEEAEKSQQRALQLNPEMAEAYAGLGLIHLKQAEISQSEKDYESALSAYRQAIALKPDLQEALLNLGNIALKLFHLQEAEEAYQKLLSSARASPSLAQVHIALGHIYLRQGKFPQAVHHHKEALKQDPNLVEAYYNLGFIAIREGKLEEAAANFNAALKIKEDMPEAHYFLGEIYVEQKQFERAEKEYQRAIEIQPSFASAYQRLAHLYGETEVGSRKVEGGRKEEGKREKEQRLNKAIQLARKAVELQPDSADYLNTLSWLYYLNKDYAHAEETIKKALMLQPDNRVFKEGLKAIQQAKGEEK
jgi:tetratricopeptide (TPR) repeat protein